MEETNVLKTGTVVRIIDANLNPKLFAKNFARIADVITSPTQPPRYRISTNRDGTITVNGSSIEPVRFALNQNLVKKLINCELVITTKTFDYGNSSLARDLMIPIIVEARKTVTSTSNHDGNYYFYSKYYNQLEYSYDVAGIPKKMRDVPRVCLLDFFTDELEQSEKSNYSIF